MATIFPTSPAPQVNDEYQGYRYNGTSWEIIGIDLTADYQPRVSNVSDTELGYLDGVTSSIQTQLGTKLSSSTAATTYQPIVTNVTDTEIGYLDGVTSAIQTQLGTKSPLASPTFTGTVTIPAGASISGYATETYVGTAITNLIDAAPSTLNTLNELAAALGDDANYASTITTALGNKLDISTASSTYQPLNGALSTLSSTFGNITIQSGIVKFANYGMGMISWSLDTNTYLTSADLSEYPNMTTTPISGFRNAIINGGMDIWQRGTSITPSNGGYNADRWLTWLDGSGSTRLITQQSFTPGAGAISEYEPKYFLRYNQSVAGSGATYNYLLQKIEDVRTFAGQNIVISFWAKTSANTTIPGILIGQAYGSGGSPSSFQYTTVATSVAVTTSWTKFTYTVTVPSLSGKTLGTNPDSSLHIFFSLPINATFTFDVWGVQVEKGSIATPFEQRPIGTELALCQRYYEKSYDLGTALGTSTIVGAFFSGSAAPTTGYIVTSVPYKVSKRKSSPTLSIWDTMTGASGKVTRETYGSSQQSVTGSLDGSGENSFRALSSSGANANGISFHWASEAEL
jgi:hypothetical protein